VDDDAHASLTPSTERVEAPQPTREQVIGDGIAWLARWSGRWVLIALGAVLVGVVIRELWVVLLPIALALVVTTVLQPLALLLERHLRFPATLAAAGAIVGAIGVVVAVGVGVAPSVASQSGDIASDAAKGIQQIQDWVQERGLFNADQVDKALESLQERLTASATVIASGVLTTVGAVTSAVVTVVIALILTFFFLKDGRRFRPWVRSLTGRRVGPHLSEVLGRIWSTLGGFIRTQALVSLIDAVFIGLALVLVGVPLAVPLAILTFFAGFVPIVGAFVAGALAVLVALVSNGPTGALIVFAVIIAVQQLEGNVLSPWLQSRSMRLHPGVVLLAITLGSTLFGVVGAFLAVPTAAVAAVVLRYLDDLVVATAEPDVQQPDVREEGTTPGPRRGDAEPDLPQPGDRPA
jgi:predicted PurR-regulated permease PerM